VYKKGTRPEIKVKHKNSFALAIRFWVLGYGFWVLGSGFWFSVRIHMVGFPWSGREGNEAARKRRCGNWGLVSALRTGSKISLGHWLWQDLYLIRK